MRNWAKALGAWGLGLLAVAGGCGDDTTTVAEGCPAGQQDCGGTCVDTRYDADHCGACDAACDAGLGCFDNTCAQACGEGTTQCDSACVDTALDPANCGACGEACEPGLLCSVGACGVSCAGGTTECGDVCADTLVDENNCGGCGTACALNEICVAGSCTAGCEGVEQLCAGACTDVASDPVNCGTCGTTCGNLEGCINNACTALDPLLAVRTSAYFDVVGQDLWVVYDAAFDQPAKVNAVTFRTDTVEDFIIAPNGDILYVAAQDTERTLELYLAPADGSASVKLNAALVSGGNVEPGVALNNAGTEVLYRADGTTDGVIELYRVVLANPGVATKVNSALVTDGNVVGPMIWSADDSFVIYRAEGDIDNVMELYHVALASEGTSTKVNPALNTGGDVQADFVLSSDDATVFYRSNEDNFLAVELFSVSVAALGTSTQLNAALVGGGQVLDFRLSHNDQFVVYYADQADNETFELYSVALASPTVATQLNPDLAPNRDVFSGFELTSDDTRVVYRADHSFNDRTHLWVVPLASPGAATQLSGVVSNDNRDVLDFVLSADDSAVLFRHNVEFSSAFDLHHVSLASPGESTRINAPLPAFGDVFSYQLSADGLRAYYTADAHEDGLSDLYVVDIANPEAATLLTPQPPLDHLAQLATFDDSPNGAVVNGGSVYYRAAHDHAGIVDLYQVDLASPGDALRVNALMPGDISDHQITTDGNFAVFLDGQAELYVVDLANLGVVTKLSGALTAGGEVSAFALTADSTRVVYLADQDNDQVDELYVVQLNNPGSSTKLSDTPPLNGDVFDFVVSHDSQFVLYRGDVVINGSVELFSVSITGPGSTQVSPADAVQPSYVLTSDDLHVLYRANEDTLGTTELYRVTLSNPGVSTKFSGTLVAGGDVSEFELFPSDGFLIYRADQDTDQINELYLVNLANGSSTKLSDTLVTNGTVLDFILSDDATSVIYRANQDSVGTVELYQVSTASPGASTKLNAPLLASGIFDTYRLASDNSRVFYRVYDVAKDAIDLVTVALATPGVETELTDLPGQRAVVEFWLLANDEVLLRADVHQENVFELFDVDVAAPNLLTQLSRWGGPTDVVQFQLFP